MSRPKGRAMLAPNLGPNATPEDAALLARLLEAYHKGAERGELLAFLVRLWGPSPSLGESPTAELKAPFPWFGGKGRAMLATNDAFECCGSAHPTGTICLRRPGHPGSHCEQAHLSATSLCWGTSDLRGLAARENQHDSKNPRLIDCPKCALCPCECHVPVASSR